MRAAHCEEVRDSSQSVRRTEGVQERPASTAVTDAPWLSSELNTDQSRRQEDRQDVGGGQFLSLASSLGMPVLCLPDSGAPPVQQGDARLPGLSALQTGLQQAGEDRLVQRRRPAGHEELAPQTSHPPGRLPVLPLLGGGGQWGVPVPGEGPLRPGPGAQQPRHPHRH